MRSFYCVLTIVAIVALGAPRFVNADEPANHTFAPPPPGTVAQNVLLYLAGQAMHSQWRAVASRKQVGTDSLKRPVYQWYLSIYSIEDSTYKLRFQSPTNGGPLEAVKKAPGSGNMWFPYQDLKIAGTGQFIKPTVDDLVVQSHETGADCGTGRITVFGYDPAKSKIVSRVTVTNGCELRAKVVHEPAGTDAIQLTGPFYNSTAPLCCPTKPNASATLRFKNDRWVQTPKYYQMK